MTEQYEYERVEIKPEDQSWSGSIVYSCQDNYPLEIAYVGKDGLLVRRSGGAWREGLWEVFILFSNHKNFYIRKPKRKMLERVQEEISSFEELRGYRPRAIQVSRAVKGRLGKEIEERDLARLPIKDAPSWKSKAQLVLKIEGIEVVTPNEILALDIEVEEEI